MQNLPEKHVVAIFGPTGVGKTAVAVALATELKRCGHRPVAISADALQLYRGIETLTGAATAEQQRALPHRLLSCLPLDRQFSVGEYSTLAHREIDAAFSAGQLPIVVGGTGMYMRAALGELTLAPPVDQSVRDRLESELKQRGLPALYVELTDSYPELKERIHSSDRQRTLRALELTRCGHPPPQAQQDELWSAKSRYPTALFGLTMERAALYRRIERRVEQMLLSGAAEEVRAAATGTVCSTAGKAVGFRELLSGDTERMKVRSRQYARRQLTWMRRSVPESMTVDVTGREHGEVATELLARLFKLYSDRDSSRPN